MKDVRTVKLRTKDKQGKTITSLIEAPLCNECNGSGMQQRGDVFETCPSCKGKGEHRARNEAYPQITEDYQAAI